MTLIISMLLALQAPPEASAQDRLRKAVDEAKRELEAETRRLALEDKAEDEEVARARSALAKSTDELVDRTASLAGKTKELDALRTERAGLRQS
ncbi:MAG TPA: hypothetical protein VEN81_00540, partial [Planctomycetota bacterium]|nr:hypothetical protein [Planctomycetota bacterium]